MNRLMPPTLCARGLDTKNKILKRDQMKSILQFSIRKAPDFVTFKTLLYLFLYFFFESKALHCILQARNHSLFSLCRKYCKRCGAVCRKSGRARQGEAEHDQFTNLCAHSTSHTSHSWDRFNKPLCEHRNARVDTKNAKSSKRATITMRN